MIKVLFVCLGNICRSPLAEGLMKRRIVELKLHNYIMVDSCGTGAYHLGERPDHRTIANATENNVMLDHKARQFHVQDFDEFDYILAMDHSNLNSLLDIDQNKEFHHKLHKMRNFDPLYPEADVPDPYFGGEDGFQRVFDILDRSVNTFIQYIVDKHKLGTDHF